MHVATELNYDIILIKRKSYWLKNVGRTKKIDEMWYVIDAMNGIRL